jgi:hypothetical protein
MKEKKIKNFSTKVKGSDVIIINTGDHNDFIQVIASPNGKETSLSFKLSENIIIEKGKTENV